MNDDLETAQTEVLTWYSPLETALLGVTRALSTETSLDALLELVLLEARGLTKAEAGTIYLVDGDHLRFTVVHNDLLAPRHEPGELLRRLRAHPLPLAEPSLATHVALTGAVLNLEDAYANHMLQPLFHRAVDDATEYQTRSMLALPLRAPGGKILGVLQLINATRERHVIVPFGGESQKVAESFASLASVAIHRTLLEEAGYQDTLTDLYNRRYLDLRIQEEAGRHKRFGHPVSIVSMNLDKFERIHRATGPEGGHAVLREVGTLLRRNSRQFTLVARDGVDDFAVVLPNTPKAGAVTYAERIKNVIAAHPFGPGPVTASFGVASLPESVASPDDLVSAASRSVSDAKRGGGNRVAAA